MLKYYSIWSHLALIINDHSNVTNDAYSTNNEEWLGDGPTWRGSILDWLGWDKSTCLKISSLPTDQSLLIVLIPVSLFVFLVLLCFGRNRVIEDVGCFRFYVWKVLLVCFSWSGQNSIDLCDFSFNLIFSVSHGSLCFIEVLLMFL